MHRGSALVQRLRSADPLVADGLLAVVLAAVAFTTVALDERGCGCPEPGALGAALLLLQTLPVAARRRAPFAVWLVTGLATLAYGVQELPDPALDLGVLVAIYTAAAACDRRVSALVAVVSAVAVVVGVAAAGDADVADYYFNFLVVATAWILGENARTRRAYTAEVEDRADRLEREREADARRAVAEERARIARELHDVVAHHVSMMVVQSEAGASVVAADPRRAEGAFDAIGATGRQALAELRRLLGVLRDDGADRPVPPPLRSGSLGGPRGGGPASARSRGWGPGGDDDRDGAQALAPQPGLGRVGALVDQVREAGLPVELVVEGDVRPLPAGVDLSAYRIVQEALTNAVKHAGPARAEVRVRYGTGHLEVQVRDDGGGPGRRPRPPKGATRGWDPGGGGATAAADGGGGGQGHGLVGMRERVALYGGELEVGPRAEGGFAVTARLPLGAGSP